MAQPAKIPSKAGKTVLEKVIAAIHMHKSPTGSSLAYLKKNLKDEHGFDNGVALLKALKKAVADGRLEQPTKSSYAIPGLVFAPPADETVEIKDTKVGTGKEAKSGSNVTMRYEGRLVDGYVFDSADRFRFQVRKLAQSLIWSITVTTYGETLQIDGGEVIKGWDRGIKGMRVGGERELVIPPKLGYGKKGSAPDIPPDATLHFSVALLATS